MVHLGNDWDEILKDEFSKPYYLKLREFLKEEYKTKTIYPNMHDIFTALKSSSFKDTKVVILGQDPYHEPNQAHGLCFSVLKGVQPPPSLQNIYKELSDDIGFKPVSHGQLTKWAEQGVLMLNTVLTVRRGQANSHKGMGWEMFTDKVISELNKKKTPVIFLLWGSPAKQKAQIITNPIHIKLTCPHPSPLSAYRGFFGCKHFSKTNELLIKNGLTPIDWQLEE
ncbi:MAG: uracil-DNA glycosylase [Acutalibacteraceae bacterium]|nr:uracil-DNA glycosylase [Acutalibacteraceae bacterium]